MATNPPALVDISASVGEVVATLGYLPPALAAAMRSRFYDFADHHKRSVVKRARSSFESGDRAQRMVASRMFGWAGRRGRDLVLEDVDGESFFAAVPGGRVAQLTPEAIRTMEGGGRVSARELMAVPIGRGPGTGLPYGGVFKNRAIWTGADGVSRLKDSGGLGDFAVIKGKNGRLLIVDQRASTLKKLRAKAGPGVRPELPVVGVLLRGRIAKARLGFYDEAARIMPRHAEKVSADADRAMTAAGRAALARRDEIDKAARQGAGRAYAEFLTKNPGQYAAARRVGAETARAVRASNKLSG